ncbi:VWA domain-containing protein [Rubinisphaera margarita]|uniref:VWA domain-containing protein n=1 Tax=Rubinisphaera margarita TaxID=2909586 RepID=UPI001EE96826|nr:VWA domain-containing protein [Rubinisphaera margarita]MCG6158410.1 VWA domain-containing protein [Rubinisphaera margarita]
MNIISQSQRVFEQMRMQRNRRGAMIVFIAAMITVFMIAVVFTVDVAYMQLVKTEVRIAADASVKAGVENLLRTEDKSKAETTAKRILSLNKVAGKTMAFNNNDIIFGKVVAGTNGNWAFQANQTPYNSMKVTLRLDGQANSSVPLFFARYLSNNNYTPTHTSIAANVIHEIVLCIDRSHSMCFDLSGADWSYPGSISYPAGYITPPHHGNSRWAYLDHAIRAFVTKIQHRNIEPDIGLITWGSDTTLGWAWWPHSGRKFQAVTVELPLGKQIDNVNGKIQAHYSDIMMGSTNMAAGLDAAIDMLTDSSTNSLAYKTIILMSDGMWNTGRDPILSAQDAAAADITIHTVSFVSVDNQSAMTNIAATTGGKSYSATNQAQLKDAFEELAGSLPIVLID